MSLDFCLLVKSSPKKYILGPCSDGKIVAAGDIVTYHGSYGNKLWYPGTTQCKALAVLYSDGPKLSEN